MPAHAADSAACLIFTFKEGLLSPIAHDLKLQVEDFELEVDEEAHTLAGQFATASVRVVCARRDGEDAPDLLSASDREKIERIIRQNVLHTARFPQATLDASYVPEGDQARIEGTLLLHGQRRPLRAVAMRRDGAWVCELELSQPDFGIKPYSAALGTLKVAPTVRVRVEVPASSPD